MWNPCSSPISFAHTLNLKLDITGAGDKNEGIAEIKGIVVNDEETFKFKVDKIKLDDSDRRQYWQFSTAGHR